MSQDFIDSFFRDGEDISKSIDDYYPGSKRKRRALDPAVEARKKRVQETEGWDEHPQVKKFPNGKEIELFSAGAMAAALGRPLVTLRLWERRGYIPRAPYRLKSIVVKGEKKPGWRMYSREMIETTVELFKSKGLLDAKRIDWNEHPDLTVELVDAWGRIHDQETN